MKKLSLSCLFFFIISFVYSQIDRNQQPPAAKAPEIQLDEPVYFKLENGLQVLLVENHKLPRVTAVLNVDTPPIFEREKAGANALLSRMLGKGSLTIEKDVFEEEIDFLGARMNFGAASASSSSLSRYFPRVLTMMANAALQPRFSPEEFEKEKAKLLENLKNADNQVAAIAKRVERIISYGEKHPYAEYLTVEKLSNTKLEDVTTFYESNFTPENAYLILIGDIKPNEIKQQIKKLFGPWKGKKNVGEPFIPAKNASELSVYFTDMPSTVQSQIAVIFTTEIKKTSPDYFAVLLANRILGGGGQSRLFTNLREDKGYTYGAYSSFSVPKYTKARFRASAKVRNTVTDSAVVEMVKEIDKIRELPVSQKELDQAKAKYVGNFVLALEQPSTIAQYALSILTEGLPSDFYTTYLQKINAVSIEDIQRVTQKYFHLNNARIFVTGKGSEVLENLEKVAPFDKTLPIKFYDKYGRKVERPDYDSSLSEGVDVSSVINAYFEAIGGKDKAKAVQSKKEIASASMQGMTLEIESKKTNAQQSFLAVKMMGNIVQKQVVNKTEGYNEAQGQRMPMDAAALAKALPDTAVFTELTLDPAQINLIGIVDVDGTKAYEIKVSESKSYFYSVNSGLKIKISETQEMGGNTITQETVIGDYKAVDGILFPHTVTQSFGPQKIDFVTSTIELNISFTDEDFQ